MQSCSDEETDLKIQENKIKGNFYYPRYFTETSDVTKKELIVWDILMKFLFNNKLAHKAWKRLLI